MSIGNQTQAIDFNRIDLTLVLGENLDSGGNDSGSRNGTGKTTIINALSYAFYGKALTKISKNNLINKSNGKSMLVTVGFDIDGISYRIERGRAPNVLKFYVGDHEREPTDDNSQGDSRETQNAIQELLGMSHTMFKHLVALNTYTEPFLSMRIADQRDIIEQLLGITQLSEKADELKRRIRGDRSLSLRGTEDFIQDEEYRIKSIQDSNARITKQIENLERKSRAWNRSHDDAVTELKSAIDQLNHIDISVELESHESLKLVQEKDSKIASIATDIRFKKSKIKTDEKELRTINKALDAAESKICPTCGQDIEHHDDNDHDSLHSQKTALEDKIHSSKEELASLEQDISNQRASIKTLSDGLTVFYDTIEEAYDHKNAVSNLEHQLSSKEQEQNPYFEQIIELAENGIEDVDFTKLNELTKLKEHQEFLLKLLTNKDSFIRKSIIEKNLSFLNSRLSHYLSQIGLPHQVEFQSDLDVQITDLGRELDFDNLSRGERNRLILSLSWAFRDVWENLYQGINLLFIDELVDSGMDTSGVESAMAILKKMSRDRSKSIWLVSHKDELASRVQNLMKVVKENGYTTYSTDIEII